MSEAVPAIVTFHSINFQPSPWISHLVLDGKLFGVRFEGKSEDEVRERARRWWIGERERQARIVGNSELEPDEVGSSAVRAGEWSASSGWTSVASAPDNSSWGVPANNHGMLGKVWLIHHQRKERARVHPGEVEKHLLAGWEKAGPKTQFNGG